MKLGQVVASSNIALNNSSSLWEVTYGHYFIIYIFMYMYTLLHVFFCIMPDIMARCICISPSPKDEGWYKYESQDIGHDTEKHM